MSEVARIHQAVLPEAFLAQLGVAVLTQIHAGVLSAPGTIALGARTEGKIAGFVLGTRSTRAMFRHVLRRRAARLAPLLLRETMCRPSILPRILESLRYPARLQPESGRGEGELVALGVLPQLQGQGCGAALVRALGMEFIRQGVRSCKVAVYAANHAGNRFYQRCGFAPEGTFTMYGRPWAVYRLDLSKGPEGPDPD